MLKPTIMLISGRLLIPHPSSHSQRATVHLVHAEPSRALQTTYRREWATAYFIEYAWSGYALTTSAMLKSNATNAYWPSVVAKVTYLIATELLERH